MQGTADDILVVQTTIRQLYERSFWESVIEELSQAVPCYTRVIKILAEIRYHAICLLQFFARFLSLTNCWAGLERRFLDRTVWGLAGWLP